MPDNKQFQRVTRADVARHAGVSETIVSYVINNNRYVDKTKRKLVEEAIRELNYRPNNIARALKGKNSNHIVFIADQINNEHFSSLVSEMDKYAYDKGYMISLCANRNTEEFVSQIISRQYDGIIISSISIPETFIHQFLQARLPVVVLRGRDFSGIENAGNISTGLYTGAKECVRHLVEKGRRHILYIDRYSERGNFSTMADYRLRGFQEQARECGVEVTKGNIVTGCRNAQEVADTVARKVVGGFPIDAIFGRNDRMACIAMKAVQRLGFLVPRDVSVIGFDNSSLSQFLTPTLTTMEIPREAIGKAAVEMLHQMIHQGSIPQPVEFTARLIQREST